MPTKKTRTEIPPTIAAEVLFNSDRTCCVCRKPDRPVQLHHIDERPANNIATNLAVLCVDCHNDTMLRGGFGRKLDAGQVIRFRDDWLSRLSQRRDALFGPISQNPAATSLKLRLMQSDEENESDHYQFDSEYVLVETNDPSSDKETNICLEAFVVKTLCRFRDDATLISKETTNPERHSLPSWLSLTTKTSFFSAKVLSLAYYFTSHHRLASHPRTWTVTFTFALSPSLELRFEDVFESGGNTVDAISRYCSQELYLQKLTKRPPNEIEDYSYEELMRSDVERGAGPDKSHFQKFVLERYGIRFYFDAYQVGCYAEGSFEVLMPLYEIRDHLSNRVKELMNWKDANAGVISC